MISDANWKKTIVKVIKKSEVTLFALFQFNKIYHNENFRSKINTTTSSKLKSTAGDPNISRLHAGLYPRWGQCKQDEHWVNFLLIQFVIHSYVWKMVSTGKEPTLHFATQRARVWNHVVIIGNVFLFSVPSLSHIQECKVSESLFEHRMIKISKEVHCPLVTMLKK